MVGEAVEDLCRGERESLDLTKEGIVHGQNPAGQSFSIL
jgi:hypothetical protein